MKKDNSVLVSLVETLIKAEKPIWKKVAHELSKPRRKKVEVNLSKLDSLDIAANGATVIVPGKVLGSGVLNKKLHIAAFSFSESARNQISKNGSKMLSISELFKSNPNGSGVVIIK